MSHYSSKTAIQKVISNEGNKSALKVLEPIWGKLRKETRKGMDKGRLQIAERKGKGERVAANFGTDVDWGKGTRGVDVHMVVYGQAEWSDKESRVFIEVLGTGNKAKEVGA